MALTIQSNPGSMYSAHGDLLFVTYESVKANDPVTYPDYRYVCDIYIGATMVARLKAVPRPDNKMGIFNVGSVIRNYIQTAFNPAIPPPTSSSTAVFAQELGEGGFFVTATMKFGEEYDFTLYTNVTVDSARVYFNHYNGRMLGQNTILPGYVGKPLTTRPAMNTTLRSCKYWFFPFMPYSTTSGQNDLVMGAYNSNGSLLHDMTFQCVPTNANALQLFNISSDALDAYYRHTTGNPAEKFIKDSVAFIRVSMATPGTDPVYQFNLVCEAKHQVYAVHFLNKFGGFESRAFTKVSRKTVDIEKSEFGKLPYTVDMSGLVSYSNSNKVYNETRSVYASQYKEKLTLNTDILTDDEYTWLGDLGLSPMVYIEMDRYLVPAVITGTNYEYKKVINDKLTNLTINVEFGDQFNAQYR